jgi:hypothetical protein
MKILLHKLKQIECFMNAELTTTTYKIELHVIIILILSFRFRIKQVDFL